MAILSTKHDDFFPSDEQVIGLKTILLSLDLGFFSLVLTVSKPILVPFDLRLTKMGQDYSYSQPSSSSDEYDITSLLQAEAEMYADEAQSSYNIA
uniref:Uncharacterized protein n=1 Tax=Brassica oleracea var. oleracea TaxID=109376 RepID=A0A0D3AQM8_BRAOL